MQLQRILTAAIYCISYHIKPFLLIQLWKNSTQNRTELKSKQLARKINEH